ncbi:hypothetical protein ASG87_09630 [Frateuria sp. Soil773]|uniref:hypothetical protein n=1 Tax=Frateuria sp. Soil773 TaxID=1736407 RepID=UPI0006FFEE2F|nr:hypothetical protein [Frateuria sp. Soil773]KRE88817.1 hypothetical protein ASG87_09630 [Frateuria sp. Soil773]
MPTFPKTCLGVYATVLSAAFAVLLLTGARSPANAKFDTIDVQRINVREPDGTLRMVISDHAAFPGLVLRGREYPHARPQAGMLFFNDEGTEQGGLIFAGRKSADGRVDSGLSLTFDRYEQDQQLQLIGLDQGGRTYAGMQVNDVPARPIIGDLEDKARLDAMPAKAREALLAERRDKDYYGAPRYFAGKSFADNSVVMLNDAHGKPRLLLMVTPEGKAEIRFLAADGKVQRTLTADGLEQHAAAGR